MSRKILIPTAVILILALAGCSKEASTAASGAAAPGTTGTSDFRPVATIQDIMDAEIDPAADFLWASVGYVSTVKGMDTREPRTDKDWETVRNNAITLVEATNLLIIPGRIVATQGSKLDPSEVAGIEDPKDIQKAIEANRAAFIKFAHALHDAGMESLNAINAKDVARLDAAGEKLDEACEQCHRTFWYPNAPEPIQTLEPPKP